MQSLVPCRLSESLELVKTLVEKGFDVNDRLPDGATPLMSAAKNNVIDIAEYLLENGAELDACDEEGWTALMTSASFKHFDMMRFWLKKAQIFMQEPTGDTQSCSMP